MNNKRILKTTLILNLFLILLVLSISCNKSAIKNGSQISLKQVDSILQTKHIYGLEPDLFTKLLDSVKLSVSQHEDSTSIKYYFLQKEYAYNLNHSLEKLLPNLELFFYYKLPIDKQLFKNDSLLENKNFKQTLLSYLDLKAKYIIADGNVLYQDNVFINTQFDIIKEELSGAIKEFALFNVMEQQIKSFGHEGIAKMLIYFNSHCKNTIYKKKIDSLYTNLLTLKNETQERIYNIVGQDSLSAYIYYPKTRNKKMPCILILHGGGWYNGHPLTRTQIPKQFNKLGFVAIVIEHRIKGRQNVTPLEGLMDSKVAIKWARKNATSLGINPNKIIVSGLSSGATLAANCAILEGYEHTTINLEISAIPNAVILWSGCVNTEINGWFQYCLHGKIEGEKFSPTHNIKANTVPFLIFQGTLDTYNPYKTHIEFSKKMEAKNNYCKLVLYQNTKHIEVYEKDMMLEYKNFIAYVFDNK